MADRRGRGTRDYGRAGCHSPLAPRLSPPSSLLLAVPAALCLALAPLCAFAACRCSSGTTEVCIVLDSTGSMDVMIGTVKEQMYRLVAALEGTCETLRVGAVAYRTAEGPEYITKKLDLTGNRAAVVEWIKGVRAVGGGYEAVSEGLEAAVSGMTWSKGARKLVILVGDEGPEPAKEARCSTIARLAKSRGIAVSAITCSDTAWRYWQWVHADEWKQRLAAEGEPAKQKFELPIFRTIAAEGGGLAVPSKDTKELLKWLLVIASGADDPKSVDVNKFMEWEPEAGGAKSEANPMLARLRHAGDWATPRDFEALRLALGRKVRTDFDSAVETVAAEGKALAGRPVVYLSGHGAPKLSSGEKGVLKKYLQDGGLLWADACCGSREFDAGLRKLLAEMFPEERLASLPADHAVFRSGYAIEKVRYCERPRAIGSPTTERLARLEGLVLSKRLAVVYSPDSLGCGWGTSPLGRPCQLADEDAVKLSMNILLYALTSR